MPKGRADVSSILDRTLELGNDTGAVVVEPLVRLELAELARLENDEPVRSRELAAAARLFTAMGVPSHAESILRRGSA